MTEGALVTDRCAVELAAASAGVERLTWGQGVIWQAVQDYVPGDEPRSLAFAVEVPAGVDRAAVLGALRELLVRNETLRTTYRRGEDGEPVQVVAGCGRIEVDVEEVDGTDLARRRAALWQRLNRVHFTADGWPLRIGVLEAGGRPRVIAVGLSHLAVDLWSLPRLAGQLDRLLHGRPVGPPARQPREQARHERSAAGRGAGEAGLRYWQAQLTSCPQTMLPGPRRQAGRSPRSRAVLYSPPLAATLGRLARVHRLTPASLLLAATAFVLAARRGEADRHRFTCLTTVGHRFDPALRDYVGTTAQHAPVSFEVDPDSLLRTARAALPALLAAGRYSQADPVAVARLTARVAADRGIALDWLVVNVHGHEPVTGSANAAPDPGRTDVFDWLPSVEPGIAPWELEVRLAGGLGTLELAVDPAVVAPADVEPTLRGLVRLLDPAVGPDPTVADAAAGASAVPGDLVRVDSCWVDLSAVTGLLAEVTGSPAAAFPERAGEGGARIVGFVRPEDPLLTPEALHARCLAALPGRSTAITPHVYVLCASAPAEVGSRDGWTRQIVRSSGTGRAPGPSGG